MTAFVFTTPRQAVAAMVDAGAVYSVRQRTDGLGVSFTYRVTGGGDLNQSREILAIVKKKPAPFFEAFKVAVQDTVAGDARKGDQA